MPLNGSTSSRRSNRSRHKHPRLYGQQEPQATLLLGAHELNGGVEDGVAAMGRPREGDAPVVRRRLELGSTLGRRLGGGEDEGP